MSTPQEQPSAWQSTETAISILKELQRKHRQNATLNFVAIVLTITLSVFLLLLGHKAENLFMSKDEREALARIDQAKYKIMKSIGGLDDRLVADIGPLYDLLRNQVPFLESHTVESTPPKPLQKLEEQESIPDRRNQGAASYVAPKEITILYNEYSQLQDRVAQYEKHTKELNSKISEYQNKPAEGLRDENKFLISLSDKYKAEIERLDKREQESKDKQTKTSAPANTDNTSTLTNAIGGQLSHILIKVGALFFGCWLIKILVRRYQYSSNLADHFTSILAAIEMAKGRSIETLRELASILNPHSLDLKDSDDHPIWKLAANKLHKTEKAISYKI